MRGDFFIAGGSLHPEAESYVHRRADEALLEGLRRGEFCYVLTPRQMGKSSLMVRTAGKLRDEGVQVALLDLTALGRNLGPEQWYFGLLSRIGERLGLEEELEAFWLAHERMGPMQRFWEAVQRVLLRQIAGPIVLFFDEIDVVRSLPFSTDEFFAAIRECYNRRVEDPEFGRLTFCLLGVAAPGDLIRDTRITPFNIGRRIELEDFTEEEASGLSRGLPGGETRARALLRRILHWTGGHPYLTQRLCQAAAEPGSQPVDRLCGDLFLSPRARERDDNLIFVRDRLLLAEVDRAALLETYAKVWRGYRVADDDTDPLAGLLRLSGIARARHGRLVVRNRIYSHVFDLAWAARQMPDAELRRQRAAYRRGLFRAGAAASLIVLAMAALILNTLRASRRAELSAARADRNSLLADARQKEAQKLARERLTALEARDGEYREKTRALSDRESALGRLEKALAAEARQTQAAEAARNRAETLKTRADRAAQTARRLRYEGERRTARLAVAEGTRALDEGDSYRALLWYAEAMRLDRNNPAGDSLHRLRIGSLLRQTPKYLGAWSNAYSPHLSGDGRRLATVSGSKALVWDPSTGSLVGKPLLHSRPLDAARISPDGKRVAAWSDDLVMVFDLQTGRPLHRLKQASPVMHSVWSPDSRLLATGQVEGCEIWDAASGRRLHQSGGRTNLMEFSPDSRRLARSAEDANEWVFIHSILPGQPVGDRNDRIGRIRSFAFTPDSRSLFFAMQEDEVCLRWDGSSSNYPIVPGLTRMWKARFGRDGRAVLAGERGVNIWIPPNPAALTTITSRPRMDAWFSEDQQQVVTIDERDGITVWEAADAGNVALAPAGGDLHLGPGSHTRAADGLRVAASDLGGITRMWDAGAHLPRRIRGRILALLLGTPGIRNASAVQTAGYPANPCKLETARFISAHGGCWDTRTGLVWSANSLNPARGGSSWSTAGAQSYADNLVEGGQTDWSLPTLAEMQQTAGAEAWASLNVFITPATPEQGEADIRKWSSSAASGKNGGPCPLRYNVRLGDGFVEKWSDNTKAKAYACADAADVVCVRYVAP